MSDQPRAMKILVSLIAAMTLGAVVLMALDSKSISGGAFSLASYSSLGSIKQAVAVKNSVSARGWKRIEVFYRDRKSVV